MVCEVGDGDAGWMRGWVVKNGWVDGWMVENGRLGDRKEERGEREGGDG